VTDRGVRLIGGGNGHEREPFVSPSIAYRDIAHGEGLEVPSPAQESLGVRVRHDAGTVASQVGCRNCRNQVHKVRGQTAC
jgi:hypothetical protein